MFSFLLQNSICLDDRRPMLPQIQKSTSAQVAEKIKNSAFFLSFHLFQIITGKLMDENIDHYYENSSFQTGEWEMGEQISFRSILTQEFIYAFT